MALTLTSVFADLPDPRVETANKILAFLTDTRQAARDGNPPPKLIPSNPSAVNGYNLQGRPRRGADYEFRRGSR
ncbi:hypothetical protein GobsT_20690 [Gemmata obscuriglobus]|uniref:Uncharacterized protein n=1 Tax=Gemmata obscuriglobus TaxID=114 RepID=A0A2Z3H1I0_9BACT|nr:hypothetical protein [Gemmata obscuriglobus]AWM39588.1 hypothetical protein C1280_23050 [Gemmata obscuriglobus]QEG27315.1 hypothetical protein GobsT_20690 [Gemmata obscuriglobus]VTS04145.1 unnamed protein product [Gemmata obscuriglobus UQM 2246]